MKEKGRQGEREEGGKGEGREKKKDYGFIVSQ